MTDLFCLFLVPVPSYRRKSRRQEIIFKRDYRNCEGEYAARQNRATARHGCVLVGYVDYVWESSEKSGA